MAITATTVLCHDVNGKAYETSTAELQWRPAAYGIVIRDNKVLLLRQFGNKYDLPGGGVELGEEPREAVIREIAEETGISAHKPISIGVESCLFRSAHSDNKSYHSLLLYYRCEYVGGVFSTEGMDEYEKQYAQGPEWVDIDRLDDDGDNGGVQVGSTVDFRPYIKTAFSTYTLNDAGR